MNLTNLFQKQAELDSYIIAKKGLEGQDLLPNTILALQVELGECANEWRGFKHWSEDKDPRPKKLLVEYVDCLHFILSIGLKIEQTKICWDEDTIMYGRTLNYQFNKMFYLIGDMWDWIETGSTRYENYYDVCVFFIGLGEMLGFSWEEIEQAYITKWNINKERQNNGY